MDIAMPAAAQPAAQPARGNAAAAVRAQAGSDAEAAHFLATLDSHLARLVSCKCFCCMAVSATGGVYVHIVATGG